MPEQHDHGHGHQHDVPFASPEIAAYAETEGEALIGFVERGADAVAEQLGAGRTVTQVIDIGCGPGVGSCVLAARFPQASVVAADGSPAMLERAAARSQRLGVADRVDPRRVDLPGDLETLGVADVVWASMVMHHVGDERAALTGLGGLLVPGGVLALVEMAGPMRVAPADGDLGRPGLWERMDAAWEAWFADMRKGLPGSTPSGDYATMLADAAFDVLSDEIVTLAFAPPLPPPVQRFVSENSERAVRQLERHADPADLAALAGVDSGAATVEVSRRLLIARSAPA